MLDKTAFETVEEIGKSLSDRMGAMVKRLEPFESQIKKQEELLKRLGGDVVEGDATLAEQVKAQQDAVAQMRDVLEKYTKQLPSLAKRHGAEPDPEYFGFWASEERAKQFGLFILAGQHPDPSVRRRSAEEIVKAGMTLRTTDGQFAKGEDYAKAMGESTDTAGGYLVPDEFMATIIRHVSEYGVARKYLRKVPMSRETQSWPKRTGGLTVYYPGEGFAPTASDMTFGLVKLTAKTWAVLTHFSRDLEEDAVAGLGEIIAFEMALALAIAEDTNAFMGDGTSTYAGITGVFGSGNVAVKTMGSGDTGFANVVHDDLVDLMRTVPDWVRKMPDAAYYMSPGVAGIVQKLKGSDNHPLYNQPTEKFPLKVNGFPVRESNVLPGVADSAVSTKFIAFGSLMAWGMLGQRKGMTIEKSTEVKFLERQVTLMVSPRQDIQEAEGTAMAVLKTAAS